MNKKYEAPWFKHYNGVRTHLEYPKDSMYNEIKRSCEKYSNNIAINYFGNKLTYKELLLKIDECAKSLKALGIDKKDKVTICMPNTPEAIIMFYAINKIGAISNIIHPLSAENEIKHALDLSKSKMLLLIDLAWEKVEKIIGSTKVKDVVIVSVKDSMPVVLGLGYYVTNGRNVKLPIFNNHVMNYKTFVSKSLEYKKDIDEKIKDDDDAVILYSGGTTGTSKGIMLSNLNFNALAYQSYEACYCLSSGMKVLSIMPIFHGFGLGICYHTVLTFGLTAIMLPQFSAKTFDKLLKKYKPNVIVGVPTLYEALLKNKNLVDMDLSFVKCALSGGDVLPPKLKKDLDDFFKKHNSNIQIREGYGLTECVAASCLTPELISKKGSIGIPIPDTYFKIVDENLNELPFKSEGEIVISGPTVMKGYLENKEETKQVLKKHKDGKMWLHTGDMGYMDEDGFVYFKQRIKRMIVSSGYNLYPSRIEKVIEELDFVSKACVVGIPHPYKIQVAKAYVILNDDVDPNEGIRNEIYDHCVKNLAKYSLPYEIVFKKEFPKTKIGKIDYKKLEEEK